MARYPVHFHINGDTSYGSFIERLAIHDNYQRSLTIHYSNGIVVNDVVAYNTFGHMYFFEGMRGRTIEGHDGEQEIRAAVSGREKRKRFL
jgi:hypothetical protein